MKEKPQNIWKSHWMRMCVLPFDLACDTNMSCVQAQQTASIYTTM